MQQPTQETASFHYPNEPTRFEARHVDDLLVYCNRINASDITIQTGAPVICEIYGKLHKVTKSSKPS